MPSLTCSLHTTITCLLLVLLLLVLMAERARHLVRPVQRHLHQPTSGWGPPGALMSPLAVRWATLLALTCRYRMNVGARSGRLGV